MDIQTRLILWNQYEILKKVNPEQKSDFEKYQEILSGGYTQYYSEFNGHFSEEASKEQQDEVHDILNMFRALNTAKRRGWVPSKPEDTTFEGFDANNDYPHSGLLRFLLDHLGRFDELKDTPRNSHSQGSLPGYRRMVLEWKKSGDRFKLTDEQAERIIA